ncbi:cytochrome P450 [Nocardia amamiensis]|uniref:cytochrome P450 n=1 Tax=Nocardia amamiensis TaxID=404578 RepID=UPI002B4AE48B|nr:cytochrome P450 [Nocardia amamiensis]
MAAFMQFPLLPLSVPTPGHRRLHDALRVLDEITHDIIRRHRQDAHERGTLLSIMMGARDSETGAGMDDKQLRDEVFTMLFAGHETSAATLSWAWYLIGRHPDVERRLYEEIERVLGDRRPTMEDLPHLVFTRRVIEETLRLYPPGWQACRQATEDDEIGGYRIPAGTTVFWSTYFVHRHRDFWEDPERFDPDRFSDDTGMKFDRPGYFLFGAGARLCIGNNFAMAEMQFVIAMLLQRYRFVGTSQAVIEPKPLVTLGASRPLIVRIVPRSR